MDRLKSLEIFKAVAQRGSFVKAADALDLSTAAITRAVQELEKMLGTRLLQRSTRRMSLTAEGRAVLERAEAVLNAFDTLAAVSDSGASQVAGEIRFSAPASLGATRLAALLGDFMARHPGVRVDLLLNDLPVDLIEHGVDLALAVAWELPPSVIARRIGEERVGVYASPDYLRRRGMPKHPDELSRHDCLVCTGGGRKPWHFGHPVNGQRIEPSIEPRLWANNANALLAAAVHGSGVALLPHGMAQRAVKAGRLQPVLSHWTSPTLGIYLAYSSRRHLPLRVRALIDHIAAGFSEGVLNEEERSASASAAQAERVGVRALASRKA